MKVPVGPTTVAGYSVTAVAFAAAVLAYLTGDHSQQTLGTILAGVLAGLAFLSTQAGRFVQAHHLAKQAALVSRTLAGSVLTPTTTTNVPVTSPLTTPDEQEPGDPDVLAHLPVADPAQVPPDQGDAGRADVPPDVVSS
jgi:hypothetical protein